MSRGKWPDPVPSDCKCETAKFLITVGVGGTVNVCCVPVSATTDETGIQSSLSERGWHQSVEAYSIHCINVSL